MLRDVTRCQRGHGILRDLSVDRRDILSDRIVISTIMVLKNLGCLRRAPAHTCLEFVNSAGRVEMKHWSDLLDEGSKMSLAEIALDQRDQI